MIVGIGIDVVNISRIEQALADGGERFEEKIFTATERKRARSSANPAATYAKRFAAKEACMKALGARGHGISWQDIEILNDESGAPHLTLAGNASKRLNALLPAGCEAKIWLSLSDDAPMALAQVVIEAINPPSKA